MEGWVDVGANCEVAQAEIRTRILPIANPALYHSATSELVVIVVVVVVLVVVLMVVVV